MLEKHGLKVIAPAIMIGVPALLTYGIVTTVISPILKAIDSARNEDGLINRAWQNFKAPFTDKGGVFDYIKDCHGKGGDIPGRIATTASLPLAVVANIPVSIAKATYDTTKEIYDSYYKENYKEVSTQTEGKTFLNKELQTSEKGNNDSQNHTI